MNSIEQLEYLRHTPRYGERAQDLLGRLGMKISDWHPRFSNPDLIKRNIDIEAIDNGWTYLDVVAYPETDESPHLPTQAQRCEEPEAVLTLMEDHLFNLNSDRTWQRVATLAGKMARELCDIYGDRNNRNDYSGWLSPKVNGMIWHRGFEVRSSSNDAIILLQPHIFFFFIVRAITEIYTIGRPPREKIIEVARDFGQVMPYYAVR